MISSIGFIPNNPNSNTLKDFIPDEEIKQKLAYLQIPLVTPGEPNEDEDTEEMNEIKQTDNIIYSTPNTEELSHVAFYGYDENEMFFHHDIFVFSTIIDSAYLGNNLVACATFEADILVYDCFTKFPVLPQKLLCGHESFVTAIKNKEDRVMSASDDKSIIEWDINSLSIKSQTFYDVSIEKFDFQGSNFAFAQQKYLYINNENISVDYDIEKLRIEGNNVFLTDCEGYVTIYDIRNLGTKLFNKKIHDQSVPDFLVLDEWIVTTSLDNKIKLWDLDFNLKNTIEQPSTVFCLGKDPYAKYDEIFGGNEEDDLIPIKLEAPIE